MIDYSILKKAVLKFKYEGFKGVISACIKRIRPICIGIIKKRKLEGNYKILYIVGCNEGESKRYRVFNIMEALLPFGVTSQAITVEEAPLYRPGDYSLIVFFRCEFNSFTQHFLQESQKAGVPRVFDIDDLIFDSAIVEQIAAYQEMMPEYQKLYRESVKKYQMMLEACDYATASTKYLCDYIQKLCGKKAFYIPNGINDKQIRTASSLIKDQHESFRIGFLSGSKTHNKDFLEAANALSKLMSKDDKIELVIIGFLDIPDCLKAFNKQIRHLPFMDYCQLLTVCNQLDLVIVPLEHRTSFCQAKSELKYFEQALIGVPVIVSPTETFLDCITHKKNGLIARNEREWLDAITSLRNDSKLHETIVDNATIDIRERYFPENIGRTAKEVYDKILREKALSRVNLSSLKISFVIPEPFKGAGGHRNIFRIARRFSQLGHEVTIYTDGFTGRFISNNSLKKFVCENYFEINAEFYIECEDIKPCDVLIATQWHTAYVVRKFQHRCSLAGYLIQDFEPYFYPMGEEYIQAFETYKFGFTHIASGRWAAKMVEKVTGQVCPYFDFPLQKEIYKIDDKVHRAKNKVIFFARPNMTRRCFMLGVEALKLLKQKMPNVKIVFYGESEKYYGDYGFEYEKLGILPNLEDLAKLYQSSTVGLCFSLTNPSLVPFEMMACGMVVVDVDFNLSSESYGGYDTVILCEPNADAISESIYKALVDEENRRERVKKSISLVNKMPNEEEVGDFVLNTFMDELKRKFDSLF